MIERPRDKTGDRYEYFTCSGRRRKTTNCTRSAILAERRILLNRALFTRITIEAPTEVTAETKLSPSTDGDSSLQKRGAEGTRTPDPLHAMQMRYQLRHSPLGYRCRGLLCSGNDANPRLDHQSSANS